MSSIFHRGREGDKTHPWDRSKRPCPRKIQVTWIFHSMWFVHGFHIAFGLVRYICKSLLMGYNLYLSWAWFLIIVYDELRLWHNCKAFITCVRGIVEIWPFSSALQVNEQKSKKYSKTCTLFNSCWLVLIVLDSNRFPIFFYTCDWYVQ